MAGASAFLSSERPLLDPAAASANASLRAHNVRRRAATHSTRTPARWCPVLQPPRGAALVVKQPEPRCRSLCRGMIGRCQIRYTKYLGLLTPPAYRKHAEDGGLLVAVDDEEAVGYALFGLPKRSLYVRLAHLCVAEEHRGRGVARELVEAIRARLGQDPALSTPRSRTGRRSACFGSQPPPRSATPCPGGSPERARATPGSRGRLSLQAHHGRQLGSEGAGVRLQGAVEGGGSDGERVGSG